MDDKEPTQQKQPKKGEPIERDFAKIAPPVPAKASKKHRKRTEDAAAHERARKRSGEND